MWCTATGGRSSCPVARGPPGGSSALCTHSRAGAPARHSDVCNLAHQPIPFNVGQSHIGLGRQDNTRARGRRGQSTHCLVLAANLFRRVEHSRDLARTHQDADPRFVAEMACAPFPSPCSVQLTPQPLSNTTPANSSTRLMCVLRALGCAVVGAWRQIYPPLRLVFASRWRPGATPSGVLERVRDVAASLRRRSACAASRLSEPPRPRSSAQHAARPFFTITRTPFRFACPSRSAVPALLNSGACGRTHMPEGN